MSEQFIQEKNNLDTQINYYNTNTLLVQTPNGEEYGGVSAWQGLRYLGANVYLLCGTTNPNPNEGYGLIYIGNINCTNRGSYYLNVPNSTSTSLYGPNYNIDTGIYSFVGSYKNTNVSNNINGFIYNGNLDSDSLKNSSNFLYPNVNQEYDITFLHSFYNDFFVGNSGNNGTSSPTVSYIYNVNNVDQYLKEIIVPYSKTTTTYGIWYNGNNSYTIVGGASPKVVSIDKIYDNKTLSPIPYGCGFIADYNSKTNLITNWTLIYYKDNFVHIEGISKNDDSTYSLNADVLSFNKENRGGYALKVSRNENNNFVYDTSNWIKLNYPSSEDGYTSSNSIANDCVIGLFISKDPKKPNISYQANIATSINSCSTNTNKYEVLNNQNIFFDHKIIDNTYISYDNNGIFTFSEPGLYLINFNIYIENTNLPSIVFDVNYSVNNKKKNFLIGLKGIDEIGTQTAHSLSLPCVFSTQFSIGDKLYVTNISNGTVNLVSHYIENCTNAIISITKLN